MVDHLDELEKYLGEAPVLHGLMPPGSAGAHATRASFMLDGGVGVLAKVAPTGHADFDRLDRMVSCERAAWCVARSLGCADLVPCTVIREVPFDGATARSSIQVVVQPAVPDEAIGVFEERDILRAGMFDVIIEQSDRGGHNWLAVEMPGSPKKAMKLIDHGYSFAGAFNSTFYDTMAGHALGPELTTALSTLANQEPREVADLLGSDVAQGVQSRAAALAAAGVLTR